jgi:hypothetical protein
MQLQSYFWVLPWATAVGNPHQGVILDPPSWIPRPIRIRRALISVNISAWPGSVSGLWVFSHDPDRRFINDTGYPGSQISTTGNPNPFETLNALAWLDIGPGYPRYKFETFEPAIEYRDGDGLILQMDGNGLPPNTPNLGQPMVAIFWEAAERVMPGAQPPPPPPGECTPNDPTSKLSIRVADNLSLPAHADYAVGTDNWAWDMRVTPPNTATGLRVILCQGNSYSPWMIAQNGAEYVFYAATGGSSWAINGVSLGPAFGGQTAHLAIKRVGNAVYRFNNGQPVGSPIPLTAGLYDPGTPMNFGSQGGLWPFGGQIREARFLRGGAYSTDPFTPPTLPYCA